MSDYTRGSEWRKWDLHVHTPFTRLNNQYSSGNSLGEWDLFCKEIEESDVSVFGITDYFSVKNYFIFLEKFKEKYPSSKKIFFPNIEFRIDSKNSNSEHIQFHIIFSNNQSTLDKINDFFTRLELVSTDDNHLTNKYCIETNLTEIGYNKAMVKIDELENRLKNDFMDSEYLIVGVANGYGSLRPNGSSDARGSEYAKELDKKSKLFFGNSKNRKFFLNKVTGRSGYGLPPKAVLFGCDAHSFDSLRNKLGKEYEKKDNDNKICDYSEITWIKADPTFEGLKQIVYEPEERVKIQGENPAFENNKTYFESIEINSDIKIYKDDNLFLKKTKILLNKNLVTIIGGRGEGKSTLINYLGNSISKIDGSKKSFTTDENFIFTYCKLNNFDTSADDKIIFKSSDKDSNNLDFIFIEQGDLKKFSGKENNLSENLKEILGIEDANFSQDLQTSIDEINNEIDGIIQWLNKKDEKGNIINNIDYQKSIATKYIALLSNLKNSQNKEQIEKYNTNLKKISKFKKYITQADDILDKIEIFKKDIEIINIDRIYEAPNVSRYNLKINEKKLKYETQVKEKESSNEEIKKSLSESGISGDLTTLLENTEKYQKSIDNTNLNIGVISQKEVKITELKEKRSILGEKIKEDYECQKENINNKWNNFLENKTLKQKKLIEKILLGNDKIKILGKINFNKESFYKLLWNSVHQGTFKKDDLEEKFKIIDLESWSRYITDNFNKQYDSISHKKKEFLSLFFDLEKRSQYLQTEAEILYEGKNLSRLSAGQKGTAYLRIHLANSAFDTPIIFDQPEDDLDNQFIVSELVDIFKELKRYRQIIIVTHNANLVVNADAEQIIVAKNEDEKLSYRLGALEDLKIQKNVCDILEGGDVAFEKRRKKYDL